MTLLIWLIALAKPLSHVREAAPAVDHRRLREFMRQGTEVIHDLASRLNQFRRKLEK
jgi:hypothetical protein